MSPQILVGKDMSRRSPEDLLKKFNGGDILWYIPPPPGLQRANQRFSSPRSNKAAGDQRGWGREYIPTMAQSVSFTKSSDSSSKMIRFALFSDPSFFIVAHTVVGYMVQFILNSAVYIYIFPNVWHNITKNKRNDKVKVISSTSSTYPININQPNQRLTRDTNQPVGLPGRNPI